MTLPPALPGFLATLDSTLDATASAGMDEMTVRSCAGVALAHWGELGTSADGSTVVPTRVRRTCTGEVSIPAISDAIATDPGSLTRLLPPFAAGRIDGDGVTAVADSMGFRQLYHSRPGATGVPVISTSATAAARVRGADLDHAAVAVQSLLGWQLGQRTLFQGVDKLLPGAHAHLSSTGLRVIVPDLGTGSGSLELRTAVKHAARLLRTSLETLLDEHPDAVLQLTGGQDSRILLSAIPRSRRRGLRAMTLGGPDSGDVQVAGMLASRYGLRHEVHGLAGLDGLTPAQAWDLCRASSAHLDAMSDPVAHAALLVAERRFDQGVRISGLGGEVGRGFYYLGKVRDRPFDRRDAERLAAWRMFANESVEPDLLADEFRSWGSDIAVDAAYAALRDGGDEWFRATDVLYLRHRMQRWAGVTDTAVGFQRIVVNPMLDPEFIELAVRLAPRDKARSRFLALLQMELDPDLGRLPLDGRPAPVAFAAPTPGTRARAVLGQGAKAARKLRQRVGRRTRPPAGGTVLATKVAEHWRDHPDELAPATRTGLVDLRWVDRVTSGDHLPSPSSVAFLTNLTIAVGSGTAGRATG